MTLWGGRFSGKLDPAAWELNASLPFDRRMADQDVRGSLAWAGALQRAGVITEDEREQLCAGLLAIQEEFQQGSFVFEESDEDIHTAVERRLGELIGALAGKLHTGRSRNDQVATDFRLWVLDHLPQLDGALREMQTALVERAEQDMGALMPGYTHLQRAQPLLLSHWWLAHFWPLQRDRQRLADLRRRASSLPLGAGALAGAPFPVDREALACELGFNAPAPNSIDAVSDRDFAAEFLFCAALTGVHLSRLSESVILFTSAEFGFFELSDEYATGSSLMPQKKNPDVFELARGKTGGLIGQLAGLLATLKGLPSAYDKDLQEDKPAVFAAYDALAALLPVLAGALRTLTVRTERMRAAIDAAMLATDLADILVEKGVPFRQAHQAAGQAVSLAASRGVVLDALSLEEFQAVHAAFDADVMKAFDPLRSVQRREVYGGTGPQAVRAQVEEARKMVGSRW
ncbi:MAG: argininosuccinate lyase [Chloroflexi bacterium]|nr:argininosuccinate lyase [Chloroflexota bacterium]